MGKPNYNMERKDRDRAKQAKAAAKLEKRAAKSSNGADETAALDTDSMLEIEQTSAGRGSS
jgi:hypothetical protein